MSLQSKRVGVLTGGGDAPGLNPAIKGLVYILDVGRYYDSERYHMKNVGINS